MQDLFLTLLPYKVLFSHFLLAFLVLAVVFRKSWGRNVYVFFGQYGLHIGLLLAIGAVVGSLFYSEIVGFEACVLCWWQRVFLYPLLPIFAVALWKKDGGVWKYVWPLALAALAVAAYQYYSVFLGGESLLACTDAGGSCSRVYVMEFGYITIELMSLTVSAYVLLLAWVNKIFKHEDSNAR